MRSALACSTAALVCVLGIAPTRAAEIAVIPRPQQVVPGQGEFKLSAATTVQDDGSSPEETQIASGLLDRLRIAGLAMAQSTVATTSAAAAPDGTIVLNLQNAPASLGDEGYSLQVTPAKVTLTALHPAGLFYGVQTLLQLMPPAVYSAKLVEHPDWALPAVQITDVPRFRWRGLMLDVARHYEPKQAVLQLLDQMAMHKLNVFHWHLTDDQGWRLEIKQYPKLTSIGAWRDSAGFGLDPKLSTTYGSDGKYGGFYTQQDVKEVLAYAAARYILVVPEIEMPGHATAAKRAYPEYFTPAPPAEPGQTKGDAGIFNGIYDPANEQTFTFLQNILGEVADLFPGPYLHVGGDEVPKGPWEHNPADVAFMKAHGLAGGEQLQSYFVQRIEKFVASKGKHMLGWDEILQGGLPPDAAVMVWHPNGAAEKAIAAGHDVVMTPTKWCYLDFDQGHGTELHEYGAALGIQRTYSLDPIPAGLSPEQAKHVLGVQGNLWSEYVPNFGWAEYMIWPREAALAEIGWSSPADSSPADSNPADSSPADSSPAGSSRSGSSPAGHNWDDFARRLSADEVRLDAMGVNHRPLIDDDLKHAVHLGGDRGKQLLIDPVPGTTIHYTTDLSFPTEASPTYTGPVALPSGWVRVTARYFKPGVVATPAAAAYFLDGRTVHVSSDMSMDYDKRQTSFFTPMWWGGGGDGDAVNVRFEAGPQSLHSIDVTSGDGTDPDTRVQQGTLEISTDGKTFLPAATFGPDGTAHAAVDGKPVAAFRVRIETEQKPKPDIRTVTLN